MDEIDEYTKIQRKCNNGQMPCKFQTYFSSDLRLCIVVRMKYFLFL
jgi:hypothetical protein